MMPYKLIHQSYVLVYKDESHQLEVVGPFLTENQAREYAIVYENSPENFGDLREWQVLPLSNPT